MLTSVERDGMNLTRLLGALEHQYLHVTVNKDSAGVESVSVQPRVFENEDGGRGVHILESKMAFYAVIDTIADDGSCSHEVDQDPFLHSIRGTSTFTVGGTKFSVDYDDDVFGHRDKVRIDLGDGTFMLMEPAAVCDLAAVPYTGQKVAALKDVIDIPSPYPGEPSVKLPVASVKQLADSRNVTTGWDSRYAAGSLEAACERASLGRRALGHVVKPLKLLARRLGYSSK